MNKRRCVYKYSLTQVAICLGIPLCTGVALKRNNIQSQHLKITAHIWYEIFLDQSSIQIILNTDLNYIKVVTPTVFLNVHPFGPCFWT